MQAINDKVGTDANIVFGTIIDGKLENEKIVDSLDMIITEMQSQKDWLDQFSDRQEFKNLEKAFGTESPFLKTLGTNETSGLWGSVNKLIEIYNKIYNFNSENFTDAGTDAWEKGKARANSSLMQNYSDYME